MSFINEAARAKAALNRLELGKINGRREMMGLPPLQPWYKNAMTDCCNVITDFLKRLFCPCCVDDPDAYIPCYQIPIFKRENYGNQVLRWFMPFLFGLVISFLWFFCMVYQLSFHPRTALITCVIMGSIFSLGMAFSEQVRCIVLLMIPATLSSKGRTLLLAYAFFLVMMYPVKNFSDNVHVMSGSLSCGQQMAYNATRELVDAAAAPMKGIMQDLKQMLAAMVEFSQRLREGFVKVRDLFIEITTALDKAVSWLGSMVKVCNNKMGEPYKKCTDAFNSAKNKCKKKLPKIMEWACNVVDIAKNLCSISQVGKVLCEMTKVVRKKAVSAIRSTIDLSFKDLEKMFYFKVELDYEYNVTLVQSRSFEEVKRDIENEISQRLRPLSTLVSISGVIAILLLFRVVFKAVWYRHKYLTSDKFDNFYITKEVEQINMRREDNRKQTILPLQPKEEKKYIYNGSFTLARSERKKLVTGMILFTGTLVQAGFYIACDYGLYWLLAMVRDKGELVVQEEIPSHLKMHVQGQGILSDIFRALITQFDPMDQSDLTVDTQPCLPIPIEPNYQIYKTVGIILSTCLLMVLLEAYLLRLRHVICAMVYPAREKMRASWLYSHIMRRRGSLLQRTRRTVKLHGLQGAIKDEEVSFGARLVARSPFLEKVARNLFNYGYKNCLGCGAVIDPKNKNVTECETQGCKGIYCTECFSDLNNMCTACMKPIQYGDLSDMSQEVDSSDEEPGPPTRYTAAPPSRNNTLYNRGAQYRGAVQRGKAQIGMTHTGTAHRGTPQRGMPQRGTYRNVQQRFPTRR